MALDKNGLKEAIKNAFAAQRNITSDPAAAADALAGAIADAVDSYVKGIDIAYTTGLVAPSSGGPVTGTFGNTIN